MEMSHLSQSVGLGVTVAVMLSRLVTEMCDRVCDWAMNGREAMVLIAEDVLGGGVGVGEVSYMSAMSHTSVTDVWHLHVLVHFQSLLGHSLGQTEKGMEGWKSPESVMSHTCDKLVWHSHCLVHCQNLLEHCQYCGEQGEREMQPKCQHCHIIVTGVWQIWDTYHVVINVRQCESWLECGRSIGKLVLRVSIVTW